MELETSENKGQAGNIMKTLGELETCTIPNLHYLLEPGVLGLDESLRRSARIWGNKVEVFRLIGSASFFSRRRLAT